MRISEIKARYRKLRLTDKTVGRKYQTVSDNSLCKRSNDTHTYLFYIFFLTIRFIVIVHAK